MAAIGVGGRGNGDMHSLMRFDDVQMLAVCDVVQAHRDRAKERVDGHQKNKDCDSYNDFREIMVRDDIDAVLIGTPDHWHAIMTIEACKHGKDVYCEKPECLTVGEGRAMADAVRRYDRVFAGGSQRVLGDYGGLPRQVRGGAIGEIKECYVSCGGPSGELLPAAVGSACRGRLGSLARARSLASVPPQPDPRWLPALPRLLRGRHDRLGRPSLWRGDVCDRCSQDGPGPKSFRPIART